jgi:UDP-N-acetylmuramoyl-L-alanyl-D-glutamate--2,6-diaminopimelate ligase
MTLKRLKRLVPERHPLRLAWHKSKAFAAAVRYGFPAKKLIVIGITGTDGKTTTVGMTAHILHENDIAVGALSTAFFRIKDRVVWNTTQKTSPSPFVIQKFLRQLVQEGCTHAVLEYSSHGLVQGRMLFTWPAIAAITNTSPEHLDYHGTMERYIEDKGILFTMVGKMGVKIPNSDDQSFQIYRNIPTKLSMPYSPHAQLKHIQADPAGCSATVQLFNESKTLRISLAGTFNLENALCAILCAYNCGINADAAIHSLMSFTGVPGRMERINEGQDFSIFVDFTVTPQSYEKTLTTLKNMLPAGGKLLVLMGSCGDRMKEKRPIIGKIASGIADVMVVTNEDPYTEDPQKIIDEVFAGIDQEKTMAHRIFDRKKAIEFLLNLAKKNDIVILCGKGSDTTMWVKEGQIPWNEREIVRDMLKHRSPRV